ncbi:cypher [Rhynchophorus ferrugineus]|uniref:cypher n=1 Tax=Rhynchophorus ferrugineus TaxID=354439 RepID=UPI003FCE90FA
MAVLERIFLAYFIHLLIQSCHSAFPPSLRFPIKTTISKVTDITTVCDSQNVNITVSMGQPFKGVLFAKDFAQECKQFGTMSNSVTISLPTSGCGIRLSSSSDDQGQPRLYYTVGLVMQQDRYLKQISDQERMVLCEVQDEAFLIKSQSMFKALKGEISQKSVNHRVGRLMKEGWSKDLNEEELEEELNEAMSAARAWMEIIPENKVERAIGAVEVGETVLLIVKSTLPAGIGWKMVDCIAHDGLGDSSQKLLDEYGCPVDELLLPVPKFGPIRPIGSMRHQEAVAKFAAFKFPDRDRLHLQCRLQICRGSCSKIECNNATELIDNRVGRSHEHRDGEILDKLEISNSVEVIAPEIDDATEFKKRIQSTEFDSYPFPKIPGDRTFCVSIDKMAIAFCILGIVFLVAVVAAALSLLKTRSHTGNQFYTRSLFSSSSGGSAFGSKLIQDSPIFGQSSSLTSNRTQYGRIL